MAKNKKKKGGGDGHKPLISKKLKRRLTRALIFGAIAGSAYALYNPAVIEDEPTRQKVEGIKSQIVDVSHQAQEQLVNNLPENLHLSQLTDQLPRGAVLGEEEIEVENLMGEVTERLKQLPQDKLQQIKADFCADVIYQATTSASH